MTRIVLSDAAKADLKEIRKYSRAEWGAAQTEKYIAAIRSRFTLLRERPEIGMARMDFVRPCRSLPVEKHIIFYRFESGSVYVVRILHQRMEASLHLDPS